MDRARGKTAVRRAACLLLSALLPTAAAAEEPLLAQIAASLSRPAVLRAEFTQTKTVAALTRPLETSGRFIYARERGILWKIELPYRVTYVLDDAGVAELDASGAVSASSGQGPGWRHVSRIFRALFAADFQALDQYFVATARGDPAHWEIALDPRPALKPIFQKVHVRGGRFVDQVSFAETNGDTMTIRFRDIREAAALEAGEFNARRRE
jgi:outer membrane lipoprotein-sorting protein